MWIESENYIGPCRRGGKGGFRLFNRRLRQGGDRDPSIEALFRQLRANAVDLSEARERKRFKLRLAATIGVARRGRMKACAAHLERLDQIMTDAALSDRRSGAVIEQVLANAAATLPPR